MGKEKFGHSMRMDIIERYPEVKGVLRYKVYRHIGDKKYLIEDVVEQNLVVDLGRVQLAHLLAGEVDDRSIGGIAFGTNGTPPNVADTEITNPLVIGISDFEYPEPGQVKFNFVISVNEGNGMGIMEFGLISENGALFSRRTREKPLNKESDISLEGSWTIIF